jgi:hypothetical protein
LFTALSSETVLPSLWETRLCLNYERVPLRSGPVLAPVFKGVHLSVGVNLLMAEKYCQAGLWVILTCGNWLKFSGFQVEGLMRNRNALAGLRFRLVSRA